MNVICIDLETFYSPTFSLSKISTEEYVRDAQFEIIGVAVKVNDHPTEWFSGTLKDIIKWLHQFDWVNSFVLAQNCLTGDHEVRTPLGWVRLDQLKDGTPVLQWNPDTNQSEFVVPSHVIRKPYKGEMLEWDSQFHKGVYTPEHRMYIQTPHRDRWFVATAAEVAQMGANNVYVPMAGEYQSQAGIVTVDPAQIRLLEATRADGHIPNAGRQIRFRLTKQRKIERVKALCDILGVTYTVKTAKDGVVVVTLSSHPTVDLVRNLLGTGKHKGLRSWAIELPQATKEAWCDELKYWDGYGDRTSKNNKQTVVHTAKRDDAHWLYEMAVMAGRCAKVTFDIPNTRGWSTANSVLHMVSVRTKTKVKTLYPPQPVNFDGTVYCVTVPTGAFVVRRNGAVWATGNCIFDASILRWVCEVPEPKGWLDTMSMSRAIDGTHVSASLKELAVRWTHGAKGTEVLNAIGKRRLDFTKTELAAYGQYCINDVELTYEIFNAMMERGFPPQELKVIDRTIRMFAEPKMLLDMDVLLEHLHEVKRRKAELLAKVLVEKELLMSNDKFADLLRSIGVEPPMKVSPTTGKPAYAFAKTDEAFKALAEHENEYVQALVAARLGNKTTLEETRTERFIAAATRGYFPIPLHYCGAMTHRWSGADGINCMTQGHDVLTPKGWVDIKDWQPNQGIMQWWPDGTLDWDFDAAKVTKRHVGSLIDIDAPFVRGVFTPEHRMVSLRQGKVVERTAEWVSNHSGLDNMIPAGEYSGGGSDMTPEQVRLWVALSADGYVAKEGGLRFGFVRQRKIERMRTLFTAVGMAYTERTHINKRGATVVQFSVGKTHVPKWLTKGFDNRILHLSQESMDAFIEEVALWDGGQHSKSEAAVFYTTIKSDAEWVATAAHLRNQRASIYEYPRDTHTGRVFHVYMGTAVATSIDTKRHVRVYEDDCLVYCPSVKSSYIIVRYNNRIHITGQCQNIPRGSRIKEAMRAPAGYKMIGIDLSNIELRVGMWLAGQEDKLQMFREQRDLYKEFASKVFDVPYDQVTKDQRQVSKTACLALIFGTGHVKLRDSIKTMSGTDIGEAEAQRIVDIYREDNPHLVDTWNKGKDMIVAMSKGLERTFGTDGVIITAFEAAYKPSGLALLYPELQQQVLDDKLQWTYRTRKGFDRIYGSKFFQQCVQSLARDIMAHILVRCRPYPILTVHDALYFITPEDSAQEDYDRLMTVFTSPPSWAPDLPLAAEGGIGDNMKEV